MIKINGDAQRRTQSLLLPIQDVLKSRYTSFTTGDKETREIFQSYLHDVSKQFNDHAPASSVTRALNLLAKSGLSREAFLARMLEAVSMAKEQVSGSGKPIKKPMAFYFAVLTDLLGMKAVST